MKEISLFSTVILSDERVWMIVYVAAIETHLKFFFFREKASKVDIHLGVRGGRVRRWPQTISYIST